LIDRQAFDDLPSILASILLEIKQEGGFVDGQKGNEETKHDEIREGREQAEGLVIFMGVVEVAKLDNWVIVTYQAVGIFILLVLRIGKVTLLITLF
jgi:hypothetical protein